MNVVPLRREPSPTPDSTLGLWWVGSASPPAWLDPRNGTPHRVSHPEVLPLRGVDVAMLGASSEEAEALLRRARSRCEGAEIVMSVDGLAPAREVQLLRAGASLVLDSGCPPDLAAARFGRLLHAVRGRVTLRRAADPLNQGDDDSLGKRLLALSFASRLLTTVQDETEIFQCLVDIVARELSSRRVSLMHVNREEGVLEMRCAVGIPKEVIRQARPRLGEGIAGTCALLGKPLFIDDHSRARGGGSDLREFTPEGTDYRNLPMSLTVPIRVKGEVVGVVNVTDRADNEPYSRQDIAFISALMGQAGYLLENAALLAHLGDLRAFSERVVNTLTDPLAVLGDDLKIVSCNERFQECFGARPGDFLWERVAAEPECRDALGRAMLDPDRATSPTLEEWSIGERMFEPSLSPFADGDRARFLLFLRDVTSRRQMERRLVSAEKMASLGVLAAGVAHEINNPLSFVKSNARHAADYLEDLMGVVTAWHEAATRIGDHAAFGAAREKEEEVDLDFLVKDVRTMMRESIEGVERVEKIVMGLKSFAHPDTQTPHRVDLRDLVESSIMLTQGKWKYKLELVRHFEPAPAVWCLPSQVEQVFMNLIVNAAQAAREWGKLEVTVRPAAGGVEVTFADTCGGIPPEIVERIFEPFFTTKDIGEGTGLGLAIAYNILENHGGRVQVSSEHGHGTTFRVWLPAGEAARPIVVKQASRFRI